MEYLRLVLAVFALCLFCSFLKHAFLMAWRIPMTLLFGHGRRSTTRVDLDEVESLPILDMDEMPSYYTMHGRDSRGRRIFSSPYPDGRLGYFHFDREASEARLALGWKGFDATSSAWEVLGVARDASVKEIKAAYRRLITKFHPDRYRNLSDSEIADLERDTKIIHAAYAELAKS